MLPDIKHGLCLMLSHIWQSVKNITLSIFSLFSISQSMTRYPLVEFDFFEDEERERKCCFPGKGFEVYTHSRVSCNDEGLSLGQLMIGEKYVSGTASQNNKN